MKLTTNFHYHRLQNPLKDATMPWSSGYLPGANHCIDQGSDFDLIFGRLALSAGARVPVCCKSCNTLNKKSKKAANKKSKDVRRKILVGHNVNGFRPFCWKNPIWKALWLYKWKISWNLGSNIIVKCILKFQHSLSLWQLHGDWRAQQYTALKVALERVLETLSPCDQVLNLIRALFFRPSLGDQEMKVGGAGGEDGLAPKYANFETTN